MRLALAVFLSVLLVLLGAAVASRGLQFGPDVFSTPSQDRLARLNDLEVHDLAAVKVAHATATARYDVGLFGSSHVVQVAERDLGLVGRRSFNFALPGSSFRQSVALLERLEADGRAPRTAVISLDNILLNQVGAIEYPSVGTRVTLALGDVAWLLRERSARTTARSLYDHVRSEWRQLQATFSFQRLYSRLSFWHPERIPPPRSWTESYRTDGSRVMRPFAEWDRRLEIAPPFELWDAYLRRDLQRLARLKERGLRVIIFESPLAPELEIEATAERLTAAQLLREGFLRSCGELGLECSLAPSLQRRERTSAWVDCCHAPPEALGRYIASLVSRSAARP